MFNPFVRAALLKRRAPNVKLLDLQQTINSVTTHTFTGVSLGDLGSVRSESGDVYGTNPHQRAIGRRFIVVVVHGEDAATTFSVNSVSLGSINGTEVVDRGGATSAINTAIYYWDTATLDGITTTTVSVTWSEAVTTAAIGVLLVENVGLVDFMTTGAATAVGTGALALNPTVGTNPTLDTFPLLIVGSTCAANNEGFSVDPGPGGGVAPTILYADANSAMGYAAAWSYVPQYSYNNDNTTFPVICNWSSTGAGDAVCAGFV